MAEFNWRKSNYDLALEYNHKALEIFKKQGNRKAVASSYNNIGAIYYNQSSYPQALAYFFKSLEIEEELVNKQGMAAAHNNIGLI